MSTAKGFSGIADDSQPNAGRIYDFLLGGSHNFEIDRQAAQQILQMAPFMPQVCRLIRWFLGDATQRLLDEGFTKFLDFASGLPTVDHIHQIAPKGSKVIYSDIDPVTVAYAQKIIEGESNILFEQCDAGKPEQLLNSGVVEKLFGDDRKVAIGFNGIAWFLSDEEIAHSMKTLYEWAAEGAKLFLCDGEATTPTPELEQFAEFYKNIGQPVYNRTREGLLDLIGKWTVEDPGFRLLEEWIDMDEDITDKIKETWSGGGFYGAILKK